MMPCKRCNTMVVELQWQAYNQYCPSCDHIYRKQKKPIQTIKRFSPEIEGVWEWEDEKSLPQCRIYMYGILVSNLYMNPDYANLYEIEHLLEVVGVQTRIIGYHKGVNIFRDND